jgi:hypothetical protein
MRVFVKTERNGSLSFYPTCALSIETRFQFRLSKRIEVSPNSAQV